MGRAKRHASSFVAEIDEVELTVRFAEVAMGLKRSLGMSAQAVLDDIARETAGDRDAEYAARAWHRMARAAITYFGECIENGKAPS